MKLVRAMRCLTSSNNSAYPRYIYNNRAYAKYPDLKIRQTNHNTSTSSARYVCFF